MVGFRNIAVHGYQTVQVEILRAIIQNHLDDFTSFANALKVYAG